MYKKIEEYILQVLYHIFYLDRKPFRKKILKKITVSRLYFEALL